ncbi:cadherin repeat domain-containing protein, partial [Zavarzinella formosa]|uniref:cadherin repeat domain-containing protein n=1 Tax=Zavarzinella formosa TaxID=360055 RepID=UPI0003793F99
ITATSGNTALISSVTVIGNDLKYTPVPNANGTAVITVRVEDDGGGTTNFVEKTFTVTVNPVNDPPTLDDITNPAAIDEDSGEQTVTLTGITTGPANESDQTIISITATSGNTPLISSVTVIGNDLKYTPVPNANGTAVITVRVTDSGDGANFVEKTFTVTVNPVNDAPVNTLPGSQTIDEDNPLTLSGANAISISDIDASTGTVSVTLTATNGLLNATGSGTAAVQNNGTAVITITGQLSDVNSTLDGLTFTPTLNYNGPATIQVVTSDEGNTGSGGALTDTDTLNITINPVNDNPTDLALSNATVAENSAIGTTIGSISTTDPDVGDSFTYAFTTGLGDTDNGLFSLSADGVLTTNAVFDFETQNTYTIRVISTDSGGLTVEKLFIISVNDVNETPTDLLLSNATVDENLAAGAAVGTVTTTDPDTVDSFTYSLTGTGNDNASFAINPTTGALTTNATFNFEAKSSYTVHVTTTDSGGLSFSKDFTISINDKNEVPTSIALSNATVDENLPSGAAVGTVTTTDPDAGDSFTYSLTGTGNDNGKFAINPTTGALTTNATFDFETKSSYTVHVTTTDAGGLSFSKDFTISINDKNEAPTITGEPYRFGYDILRPDNSVIGTITASDVDAGDTKTFSLVGGNDSGLFSINASTGDLTLLTPALASGNYSLTVRVTDAGGLSDDTTVVVLENKQPTVTMSIPDQTKSEDSGSFTVDLADYFSDAETATANLVFSVDSNSAPGVVSVTRAGSVLTITPLANQNGVATLVMRATDEAGLFVTDSFDVTVTPVNDAPTLDDITDPAAILEDAGEQTVTITGISPGLPANESGQGVTVTAVS